MEEIYCFAGNPLDRVSERRRRSHPHSGHSYSPTTVSGRDESECMERRRIGTLSS